MTQDVQNAEKIPQVVRYAECQRRIKPLSLRVHGCPGYLDQLDTNLETAKDMGNCTPVFSKISKKSVFACCRQVGTYPTLLSTCDRCARRVPGSPWPP